MHYWRWSKYGTTDDRPPKPGRPPTPPAKRLAANLRPGTNGCIEWSAPSASGYGYIEIAGVGVPAHRLAWTLVNGPIPDGLYVCHRCDNRPCCNIDHLFLGTSSDNARDMVAKGRHWKTRNTHCPQGHPFDAVNTYWTPVGSRQCRTCRRERQRKGARGQAA